MHRRLHENDRAPSRQFDSWIGEWDVTAPDGRLIGTDHIEAAEGGCLLRETWTGAASGTGQSVNFYDRLTGYWRQVWMDPSGQNQDYYGEFSGDTLVFRQVTYTEGLKSILTMTYAPRPDGTLRQLVQRSIDDGATWTTLSDYTFKRKAQ